MPFATKMDPLQTEVSRDERFVSYRQTQDRAIVTNTGDNSVALPVRHRSRRRTAQA
jgi:hypothetical protein